MNYARLPAEVSKVDSKVVRPDNSYNYVTHMDVTFFRTKYR